VVKSASIDRYSCLSGSLPLLSLNTCVILCFFLRRINTLSQSVSQSAYQSVSEVQPQPEARKRKHRSTTIGGGISLRAVSGETTPHFLVAASLRLHVGGLWKQLVSAMRRYRSRAARVRVTDDLYAKSSVVGRSISSASHDHRRNPCDASPPTLQNERTPSVFGPIQLF